MARVLVEEADGAGTLLFNYRSEVNEVWADPSLLEEWRYRAIYPQPGSMGMRVEL